MSVLISKGNLLSADNSNPNIEFLFQADLKELELRSRRLPKKPEAENPPPTAPKLKIMPTELKKPKLSPDRPQLETVDDFSSDLEGHTPGSPSQDSAGSPVFRIQPIYPRRAALQNIEGFVILKFDITETGQTDNISVLQASPPQIFNSSAIQALRKWKYRPKIEQGQAIRQNNIKVQLDFRLRD